MGTWLERVGAALWAPSQALRRLRGEDRGREILLWVLLYVAVRELVPAVRGLVFGWALQNSSGAMAAIAAVGRAALIPVVLLIVVESILGPKHRGARRVAFIPLIVVTAAVRLWGIAGGRIPVVPYLDAVVGASWALSTALLLRRKLDRETVAAPPAPSADTQVASADGASASPAGPAVGAEPSGPSWGWRAIGLATLLGIATVAATDARYLYDQRESLGPVAAGDPVPDFAVPMLDQKGEVLTPQTLAGKPSMLVFWASWCGACRREFPVVDRVRQELGDEVRVVAVNKEGGSVSPRRQRELAAATLKREGVSFEVALDDGSMSRAFGVSRIPHIVLLDRTGAVEAVHSGTASFETLHDELSGLIAAR